DYLLDCLPELRGQPETIARALFPGAFTFVFPNPAQRFRWLTGPTPGAIGVRVPGLVGPPAQVLARVGAVIATSAKHPGRPDPASLDDVPREIVEGAAAALDGGTLNGTPSTVIDFTGAEPRVLRAGAANPEEALERVASVVAGAQA